jgi:hypothetical protein
VESDQLCSAAALQAGERPSAEQSWSLSTLTLPHPLVRVLVAESLYRAWSITTNPTLFRRCFTGWREAFRAADQQTDVAPVLFPAFQSLSTLTLPHPLVRVLVAESLYRAWSITTNHPYHRESLLTVVRMVGGNAPRPIQALGHQYAHQRVR